MVNSKGRAYTQRVEANLALVEIEMPNGAFDEGWEPTIAYIGLDCSLGIICLFFLSACFSLFRAFGGMKSFLATPISESRVLHYIFYFVKTKAIPKSLNLIN